jgi:hypothetical protein
MMNVVDAQNICPLEIEIVIKMFFAIMAKIEIWTQA